METNPRIERRSHPRTRVCVRIDIVWPEGGSVTGCARNLSEGGVFVDLTDKDFPITGSETEARFHLPGGIHVLQGRVEWESTRGLALSFLSSTSEDRQFIDDLIRCFPEVA